jgi:hypothetical protein
VENRPDEARIHYPGTNLAYEHPGTPLKSDAFLNHHPQQQEATFREGWLVLTVQAYNQGQISAPLKATTTYDVPRSTAQLRVKSIQPKRGSMAPNRHPTPAQEESLKQWILSMD